MRPRKVTDTRKELVAQIHFLRGQLDRRDLLIGKMIDRPSEGIEAEARLALQDYQHGIMWSPLAWSELVEKLLCKLEER